MTRGGGWESGVVSCWVGGVEVGEGIPVIIIKGSRGSGGEVVCGTFGVDVVS
jgi:hypothetical protein